MDHGNARIRPQRRECKSPDRAFDAGRSQWLWRCVKCKLEYASALRLTELTCIPNDPGIDYAAAPDCWRRMEAYAV